MGLFASCEYDLNTIDYLEKKLKINLNSNYKVVLDKTKNSWRKDVLSINIKLKISPKAISDIVKQIENSKYFNIKTSISDSTYFKDNKNINEFYNRYRNKIINCGKISELPQSYYQKEFLLLAESTCVGHWIKSTNNDYIFRDFYDEYIVYIRVSFNKQDGILHYEEWPVP
jgi:hypothetical protein